MASLCSSYCIAPRQLYVGPTKAVFKGTPLSFKFSINAVASAGTRRQEKVDSSVKSQHSPVLMTDAAFSSQTYASQGTTQQRTADGDILGLMLSQRIVFLGSQLDDYVADSIVSQLLLLDASDPNKDIRLFINCGGGSTSAIMAVYDAMQLCRSRISTVGFGFVASTATLLLAGGSPGLRFAMPNTRIMMHQPLGGASGQAIDVEIQAKEVMHHKINMTRLYSQITGRSVDQVKRDIDRDRYMSPVEAMESGLIDGVIDQETILPLQPIPELVEARYKKELEDPRGFLSPNIPDDEIF